MSTGAIILIGILVVTVSDMLFAIHFRGLVDRVESGETVSSNMDPDRARTTATIIFISAPLMWLVIALMSFGVLPFGIDPIKF